MTREVVDLDVEKSVRAIYDAQFGRLAGWTTKLVGDPDLAHDLATEAFVKLLRNWSTVREPRAWLYVTVANLVRDHWRKRGREATAYERHQAGAPEHADLATGDLATTLSVREAVLALTACECRCCCTTLPICRWLRWPTISASPRARSSETCMTPEQD